MAISDDYNGGNQGLPVALIVTLLVIVATGSVFMKSTIQRLLGRLRMQQLYNAKKSDPPNGKVSGIFCYPVKSLQAVSLQEAELDIKGIKGDRRFMFIAALPSPAWGSFGPNDPTHRFFTQRQCPSLATITATIDDITNTLTLEHTKSKSKITISTIIPSSDNKNNNKKNTKTFKARIWDNTIHVIDMGDNVAKFIQTIVDQDSECVLGDEGNEGQAIYENVRLVTCTTNEYLVPDSKNLVPAAAKSWFGQCPPIALTDGFPILIACETSLRELNNRLKANNNQTEKKMIIEMNRFRPNIVIEGTSKPFDEDYWKVIAIGDQIFTIVKACPRCKQSCTDQQTGQVTAEPVNTMKSFRALGQNKTDVYFAQNAIPLRNTNSTIQVGAPVRVLERGDPAFY